MLETISSINSTVNGIVWGVPAMVLIFGVGLYLSIRTGFLQFRKFGTVWQNTIGKLFHRSTEAGRGAVTPFQAVCTALAPPFCLALMATQPASAARKYLIHSSVTAGSARSALFST